MKQIRKRLTYANVVSSLALFLVLTGATAFAATELAKNSVGSKQLKKNAVTTAKVTKEAIKSAKLANGSVITAKLADGSVVTAKIVDGSVTTAKLAPQAVTSDKLADSAVTTGKIVDNAVTTGKILDEAVGAAKMTKSPFQLGSSTAAAANSVSSVELECAAGTKMLTGGVLNSNKELKLLGTYPNTERKWKVVLYNESGATINYTPIVLCLK